MNFCIQYNIFQHFSKSTNFWKILQKKSAKILRISEDFCKDLQNLPKKLQNVCKNLQFFNRNLQNLLASTWFCCRFWKTLQNAYLDAKISFDPAENEPPKECCVVGVTMRQPEQPLLSPWGPGDISESENRLHTASGTKDWLREIASFQTPI